MSSELKHTAVAITALGVIEEIEVTTERPGEGEVLIENKYAAMMAIDGYQSTTNFLVTGYPITMGWGNGGIVKEIGPGVTQFAVGDKVMGMTFQGNRAKAMQKFSILTENVVGKVPDTITLAESASIPDNLVTAFWTVFGPNLGFPFPATFPPAQPPKDAETPILVYGAGSSSGQYILQTLYIAGYKNVIATASPKHHDYIRQLGAAHVFDYSSPTLSTDITTAANGPLKYAVDPIASTSTLESIRKVIAPGCKLAVLLPVKEGSGVTGAPGSKITTDAPEGMFDDVEFIGVRTFLYQQDENMKQNLMPRIIPQLLAEKKLAPNRLRVLNTGSFADRAKLGVDLLVGNKVSGEKIVVEIP